MSKRILRMLGLWLCSMMLVIIMPQQQIEAQQDDLADVKCAVLPDQILGQANFSFAGAANFSFAGASGAELESAGLVFNAAEIVSDWQYSSTGPNPVAILIVDDFSSDPLTSSDGGRTADPGEASHGWYVDEFLNDLRDELPPTLADQILLERVDVGVGEGFRSDRILENLQEAISDLQGQGIDRFVVNMSFVFVACEEDSFNFREFVNRRRNNPNATLIEELGGDLDYFEEILADRRIAVADERGFDVNNRAQGQGARPDFVENQIAILRIFEVSRLQSDPLRQFFRRSDVRMIPVASAGNFKWRRPFFPARWPEVISVSANEGNSTDIWTQSNQGEISTPGAFYLFSDDIYRAGTSFAAPIASMMVALDLTQDSPQCGQQGNAPELASNGRYRNVPLSEAVRDRCR